MFGQLTSFSVSLSVPSAGPQRALCGTFQAVNPGGRGGNGCRPVWCLLRGVCCARKAGQCCSEPPSGPPGTEAEPKATQHNSSLTDEEPGAGGGGKTRGVWEPGGCWLNADQHVEAELWGARCTHSGGPETPALSAQEDRPRLPARRGKWEEKLNGHLTGCWA